MFLSKRRQQNDKSDKNDKNWAIRHAQILTHFLEEFEIWKVFKFSMKVDSWNTNNDLLKNCWMSGVNSWTLLEEAYEKWVIISQTKKNTYKRVTERGKVCWYNLGHFKNILFFKKYISQIEND